MKKNSLMPKNSVVAAVLLMILPMLVFGEGLGIGTKLLSVGPRATFSTPNDADEGQWYAGAQARLHMTPALALEGSVDYRSHKFSNLATINTYPFQGSLLVYLMPGAVMSPFLLGGGGWYYTQVDGPFGFSQTYTRFALHAGAGLELMLNGSVSIDGSYRYIWLESVASKDANAADKTYQDRGSMIAIGLNLLF